MTSPLAAYLASMPALTPLTAINHSAATADTTTSPQKRPRSDSPDSELIARNESSSSLSFSYFESISTSNVPATLTAPAITPASTCVIRSILSHFTSSTPTPTTSSSPPRSLASSPPTSCPLSRRSSTGASAKSVRFARCTNASVFPALSGDEYDRSPIIPTCEAESLELPKRKRSEAEGWIKCVERARADAKKRAERDGKTACAPFEGEGVAKVALGATSGFGPVEGVNGLIGGRSGGYFVGDEHDRGGNEGEDEGEEEEDDGMVVDDDFEEGNEDEEEDTAIELTPHHATPIPANLLADDASSGDDSDTVPPSSITSDHTSTPSSPPSSIHPDEPTKPASPTTPTLPTGLGFGGIGFERTEPVEVEEAMSDEDKATLEREEEEKLERRRACKAKYGLCSLGKFSRKEVFQSYDSLGGF